MTNAEVQTFQDHVHELRKRLVWVVGALIISGIVGYMLRDPLIKIVQKPLNAPLFYTSPAGSFNFVMQIVGLLAIFCALPVLVYHLVRFIEPALPKKITNYSIMKVIFWSWILATTGIAFAYYVIIPMSLHFFSNYSSHNVQALISTNEYMSFVMSAIITFALIFQIPLIILFINYITPLKPKQILKHQKFIVIGALVLALILPFTYSPITQFVLAAPIIILYYLSVILVYMGNKKLRRREKAAAIYKSKVYNEYDSEIEEQNIEKDLPIEREIINVSLNRPKTVDGFGFTNKPALVNPRVPVTQFSNTVYAKPKGLSIDGFIR